MPWEHFMQDGHNKGQKWYGPNRSRRYVFNQWPGKIPDSTDQLSPNATTTETVL